MSKRAAPSPQAAGESKEATLLPPTVDDVPLTRDYRPLNTREQLIAHLQWINAKRSRSERHAS